jgi:methylmalonyl-CoA/ethylmalonyl-CoA epimerase
MEWNISGIDHVGIAVKNLEEAILTFKTKFGLENIDIVELKDQGVKIALLETGCGFLELMQPTDAEGTIARFLSRSGGRNSIHHIAFGVRQNLENIAEDLRALGVEMVYQKPRIGVKNRPINFCQPRMTSDILIELCYIDNK